MTREEILRRRMYGLAPYEWQDVFLLAGMVAQVFVLMRLWEWFIAPWLMLPDMPGVVGIAIILMVSVVKGPDCRDYTWKQLYGLVGMPLVALGLGKLLLMYTTAG